MKLKRLTEIVIAFIACLAIVFFFGIGPPSATAQNDDETQAIGDLSLPDTDTPGIDTVGDDAKKALGMTAEEEIGSPVVGTNVRAAGGPNTRQQSELSMASSGPSIVITFNDFDAAVAGSGFVTSTDGGLTFSAKQGFPVPAGSNPCCDPTLVADLVGNFYFVQLYRDDGANTPAAGNCTNSLHISTDGGQNFSNLISSPFSFAPGTTDFPDMPHMGIDRVNLVGGQPQLYVFTRHFTTGINCPATGGGGQVQGEYVCSTDGGQNWTAPAVLSPFTDLAHWATGSDASAYLVGHGFVPAPAGTCVVTTPGVTGVCSNGQYGNCVDGTGTAQDNRCNLTNILLRRSVNDCDAGLNFGTPVEVATNLTFSGVGIDREFPQPYVSVDKIDPDVAYVVWSTDRQTGVQDRDIFLARCTFAGTAGSCEAPVRISDNPIADGTAQFFPTICVDPNNTINIGWDDQRAGGNSTAIYHTEVSTEGGALSVGPSFLTSEVSFVPFNFGGTPDYGDYSENNDACDGEHFYVAWSSHVSPPGITPASNDVDVFFAVVNNLADIRVSGSLDFGDVCTGDSDFRELQIFNVGDAYLTVDNVSRVAGSIDISVEPDPVVPVTISPDGQVNFSIKCTPSSSGTKTATIRIESDDPEQPQIDLTATCNGIEQDIASAIADDGDFGDVCLSDFSDLDLTINNSGGCDLTVSSIASSDFQFKVPAGFQAVIGPGDSIAVPIRFEPTSLGPQSADITINSDDPDTPSQVVAVSGNVPPGDIRVTGSTDFGDVCAGEQAEKTVSVCNVGACNLNVSGASIECTDFTLINDPFPATVSPDSCLDLVIRFTPTSAGQKTCTLTINSDDPDTSAVTLELTANTPLASIDVPPDQAFPPTVIQSVDACESGLPFPVSNTGTCNLEITDLSITTNAEEYSLSGLPSFSIILGPGDVAGEGALNTVFAPDILDRDRLGEVSVTYVSDPITLATTEVTRHLCGEGVRTGARVLVTQGGVPLNMVKSIKLQRLGPKKNKNLLDTIDNARNLQLQTETPVSPCVTFQYHREYGTVSNPIQLAPGSYVVTVQARINGKQEKKTVGFDVSSCDFNPNIVVDF